MHKLVLVNCLGSLAKNRVIRLTEGSPHVPQVRGNPKTHIIIIISSFPISKNLRITAYGCNIFAKCSVKFEARVMGARTINEIMEKKEKLTAARQNQKMTCAPSEDSDQPGHLPSLIRVFAVRMKKHWILIYPLSAQQRLWSDWVNAQADLSLRWAHRSFCWFCHAAAQILVHSFEICLESDSI